LGQGGEPKKKLLTKVQRGGDAKNMGSQRRGKIGEGGGSGKAGGGILTAVEPKHSVNGKCH